MGTSSIESRFHLDPSLKDESEIQSVIGVIKLSEGNTNFSFSGGFFIGFKELIFNPLPEGDPLPNNK